MNKKWLHLSDVHAYLKNADTKVMKKKLLDYLNSHYPSSFDYIMVTGDFSDKGRGFTEAELFIDEIKKFLIDPDDNKLFIVPGNHDVDHNNDHRNSTLASLYSNIKKTEEYVFDENHNLKEKFINLTFEALGSEKNKKRGADESYYGLFSNIRKENHKDIGIHYFFQDESVNIFCFNTTVFSYEQDEEGKLIADLSGLSEIIEKHYNNHKLNIVVGHHPLDWFTTEMREKIKMIFETYHIDIYLCGHEHDASFNDNTKFKEIINASCNAQNETVKPGFTIYEYTQESHSLNATFFTFHKSSMDVIDNKEVKHINDNSNFRRFELFFSENRALFEDEYKIKMNSYSHKIMNHFINQELYSKTLYEIISFYCEIAYKSELEKLHHDFKDYFDFIFVKTLSKDSVNNMTLENLYVFIILSYLYLLKRWNNDGIHPDFIKEAYSRFQKQFEDISKISLFSQFLAIEEKPYHKILEEIDKKVSLIGLPDISDKNYYAAIILSIYCKNCYTINTLKETNNQLNESISFDEYTGNLFIRLEINERFEELTCLGAIKIVLEQTIVLFNVIRHKNFLQNFEISEIVLDIKFSNDVSYRYDNLIVSNTYNYLDINLYFKLIQKNQELNNLILELNDANT